jgi:beta-lactamase class A
MRRIKIALAAVASIISSIASLMVPTACGTAVHDGADSSYSSIISDTISEIVASYPGEIGVAVIIDDSDTVAVNNRNIYPMMSVFKVHQALALCDDFDRRGISLDTLITIRRDELDPHTWSPMMKDYPDSEFSLTVKDLLRYTLRQSDNNASNLMFGRLLGVEETDSFISTVILRRDFRIAYTEAEMSADHRRAYSNSTSPLGAAELINRLFTDSLVSRDKQDFIMRTLGECETGKDRIAAPLIDRDGVSIAHKTGSGYINEEGVLAAHNDVAYICLPNGTRYSLAVFVKDFKGNETQAAEAIAHVSAAVYSILSKD